MVREFNYRGKSLQELQAMSIQEFAKLTKARARRAILRGFTERQKKLLETIKQNKDTKKRIKTHCRDMIVIPEIIGATVHIYSGKDYTPITFTPEMLGHYFGEFLLTRKEVKHKAPGVGATRSSKSVSVK